MVIKKVYIAGKIRGCEDFKERFDTAKKKLQDKGYIILSPADLPEGMTQQDYSQLCTTMITVSDTVYMLSNWKDSLGAKCEKQFAEWQGKEIWYQ